MTRLSEPEVLPPEDSYFEMLCKQRKAGEEIAKKQMFWSFFRALKTGEYEIRKKDAQTT